MASYRALRGLAVVLIGWAGARATFNLAFDPTPQMATPAALARAARPAPVETGRAAKAPASAAFGLNVTRRFRASVVPKSAPRLGLTAFSPPPTLATAPTVAAVQLQPGIDDSRPPRLVSAIPGVSDASARPAWRVSGWLFLRDGPSALALANNGQLGGSQAGARITAPVIAQPLGIDLAPTLRLSSALAPFRQQEGAAGLSLGKTFVGGGVALIAERRFSISGAGRNAFGAGLSGGWERNWPDRHLTVRGYAQAGIVGLRTRDGYADGSLGIEREFVRTAAVRISGGAAAWGAAQPGVSRVDIGPAAAAVIDVGPAQIRAGVDWRFRVAGNALPGSGPVVTIGTDF